MRQEDDDGDCVGNACDELPNDPQQPDDDHDDIGDVCDECIDTEGDGYGNPGYSGNTCAIDNCLTTFNPAQEDTYPPQGNSIGDACDCEGDFACDGDVDGGDASTFKVDFGRSIMVHPCITGDFCDGDFSCDGDVDGTDASLFKQDFGRSSMQNPCPACVAGGWCAY
jgi:hypothetical protein